VRYARGLQVVLIVCGVLAMLASLPGLPGLAALPLHTVVNLNSWYWDVKAEHDYFTITHLVIGTGFVIAGIRVEQAGSTYAGWLRWLVIMAGLAIAAELVLHSAVSHHVVGVPSSQADLMGSVVPPELARRANLIRYVWIALRVGVLAYLLVSIRRVAAVSLDDRVVRDRAAPTLPAGPS